MWHNSATQPFAHDGGTVGVLLCHGFTGSPASMRPWAEFMARHGYTVRLQLLPGHGTSWKEMNRTTWQQWYDANADAYRDLRSRCDKVFVCGLSMGGTLTLKLAQEFDDVAGIVLVNASVFTTDPRAKFARFLQHVLPSLPGIGNDIKRPGVNEYCYDRLPVRAVVQLQELWKHVSRDIAKVSQPAIIFHSVEDHVVEQENAAWLAENLASPDKAVVTLNNSYHVATLDYDAEEIFQTTLNFVRRLS